MQRIKKHIYLIPLIFILLFSFSYAKDEPINTPPAPPVLDATNLTLPEIQKYKKEYLKIIDPNEMKKLGDKIEKLDQELKDLNNAKKVKIKYGYNPSKEKKAEIRKRKKELEEEIPKLQDALKEYSSKIKEQLTFMNLYKFFQTIFIKAAPYFQNIAVTFLKIFATLEILNILINKPTELPIQPGFKILIRSAIIYFLIKNWSLIFFTHFLQDIKKLAYYVVSFGNHADFTHGLEVHTDALISYYWQPLTATIKDVCGLTLITGALTFPGVAVLGVILVVFLTIEYFMALLEFVFMINISVMLLPMIVWQHTQNIGMRIVGVIVYQFFKMFMFFFFIMMGFKMIPNIGDNSFYTLFDNGVDRFTNLCMYIVFIFVIYIFIKKCSAFANMLVGGGSALSGSDAKAPVFRAAAGAMVGLAAVAKGVGVITRTSHANATDKISNAAMSIRSKFKQAANLNQKNSSQQGGMKEAANLNQKE